jgi:hypothetical protein
VKSKNTLCERRAAMELMAHGGQVRQAEYVNRKRLQSENYKQILEVGDVGVIRVEPNTRGATDHPALPVMVSSCKTMEK